MSKTVKKKITYQETEMCSILSILCVTLHSRIEEQDPFAYLVAFYVGFDQT